MKERDSVGGKRECINFSSSSCLSGSQSQGCSGSGVFRSCGACGGGGVRSKGQTQKPKSRQEQRQEHNHFPHHHSHALASCQNKKVKMITEGPPVKAVPVRNKPIPQSALFKVVLDCARNTAPPAPEGTSPHERQTWPGPPSAPPPPPDPDEEGLGRWQIGVLT